MNLQPLDENTLLGYIAFQFPQISLQEQQEKIKKYLKIWQVSV